MDLAPKHYVLMYALIVIPLGLSFLFLRKGPTPTRLNLTGDKSTGPHSAHPPKDQPNEPTQRAAKTGATTTDPENLSRTQAPLPPKPAAASEPKPSQRNASERSNRASFAGETALNVLFQWNGHSWDAYEVLGLPAGSSREAVLAQYHKQIQVADVESLPFFRAAFEAIMKSNATRG